MMVELLEGVGNEVLWSLFVLLVIAVVCLAWMSTGIAPIEYYVWLIQMYIYPNRRIVQVLHMDHEDAGVLEGQLAQQNRAAIIERSLMEGTSSPGDPTVPNSHRDSSGTEDRSTANVLVSRIPLQSQLESELESSPSELLRTAASSVRTSVEDRSRNSLNTSTSTDSSPTSLENANSVSDTALRARKSPQSISSAQKVASDARPPSEEKTDSSSPSTCVKLKFLDDTQISASTALEATVGQFKRRYFWESMLAGKVVRLIYRGQLLRDDSRSLSSYGLHDKCVLHCHVSSTPYAQPSSNFSPFAQTNSAPASEFQQIASQSTAGGQSVSQDAGSESSGVSGQPRTGSANHDMSNTSLVVRLKHALVRGLRTVLSVIVGTEAAQNVIGDDADTAGAGSADDDGAGARDWEQPHGVTIGARLSQYLHLLFVVKFVMLWTFVFFYPQYTDRFSLLLLTFLSLFFATLLFSSHIGDGRVLVTT